MGCSVDILGNGQSLPSPLLVVALGPSSSSLQRVHEAWVTVTHTAETRQCPSVGLDAAHGLVFLHSPSWMECGQATSYTRTLNYIYSLLASLTSKFPKQDFNLNQRQFPVGGQGILLDLQLMWSPS